MILEIVHLTIKESYQQQFEEGISAALPLLQVAKGCHRIDVVRSIEQPNTYFCLTKWDTVEHHLETFEKSSTYQQLLDLIGGNIMANVEAFHCNYVIEGRDHQRWEKWL